MTDWISVKDRLPEKGKSVLVWCPIWGMYLASYNRILDTNWGEWRDFNVLQIPEGGDYEAEIFKIV